MGVYTADMEDLKNGWNCKYAQFMTPINNIWSDHTTHHVNQPMYLFCSDTPLFLCTLFTSLADRGMFEELTTKSQARGKDNYRQILFLPCVDLEPTVYLVSLDGLSP
jgi:hypothetical protein